MAEFSLNSIGAIRDLSLRSADVPDGIIVQRGMASDAAFIELADWGYVEKLWGTSDWVCYKTTEVGKSVLAGNLH
jgi:hypothetical protein